MKIRFATTEDIPAILDLGEIMVAESRFRDYGLNRTKTAKTLTTMIERPAHSVILLAERAPGDMAAVTSSRASRQT